ncbi:MAG: hypothetical protein LAT76_11795 [Schleiferiaceae bacterium]|nr:hypothetical protein [Schleiferiaceae bacterium]
MNKVIDMPKLYIGMKTMQCLILSMVFLFNSCQPQPDLELVLDKTHVVDKENPLNHWQFIGDSVVAYDFTNKEFVVYHNFDSLGSSGGISKYPIIDFEVNQKVADIYFKKGRVLLNLYSEKSENENLLMSSSLIEFGLRDKEVFFERSLPVGVNIEPQFYFFPPTWINDSLFLRGYAYADFNNYFSNPHEIILTSDTIMANTFPVFEDDDYYSYGTYCRSFLGRCVLNDSIFCYSLPVENEIFLFSKNGVFLRKVLLGDKSQSFEKLAKVEDFSEMMENIQTKPFYAAFGIIEDTYIYRVLERENPSSIKTIGRNKRTWSLFVYDIKRQSLKSFDFEDQSYAPNVYSDGTHLILTRNESTSSRVYFDYFSILPVL